MNERAQRTERAAHRLIKSRARKHVYRAKSQQTDGTAFDRMVMLEEAIEEEALRDWRTVLALWPQDFERLALPAIIAKAARLAYHEGRTMCDELGPVAMAALHDFFIVEYEPQEMVT